MIEVWKDIDGYDGKYQVSNYGRIRSTYAENKRRIVILKPMVQKNGYLYVALWKNNKKKNKLIHRLVASLFVDNPNCYTEVNHKDENKENNMANNLEWCAHKDNINYGTCKQKISESKINHPKHSKPTYQYTTNGELIRVWPSAAEIERRLGYCAHVIGDCRMGKIKSAYGYIWTEKEKMEETNEIL
jgi:hypothetical protein